MSFGGGGSDDIVQNIINRVVGQDDLERLNRTYDLQTNSLLKVHEEYRRGNITLAQYQSDLRKIGEAAAQTQAKIEGSQAKLAAASGGMRNLGAGALEAARGLEDLNYGLAAAINNLSPVIQRLGGSDGLAALVGLVGANYLAWRNRLQDVNELLGNNKIRLESEAMKELADNTHRTAEETRILNEEKERTSAIERLRSARSEDQKAQADAVVKAIGESGGLDKIVDDLVNQAKNRGQFYSPREKQDILAGRESIAQAQRARELADQAAASAGITAPLVRAAAETAYQQATKGSRERIEAIRTQARGRIAGRFGDAETDPAALNRLIDELGKNGGDKYSALRSRLQSATAEGRDEAERIKKDQAENDRLAKEASRKAKADYDKKFKRFVEGGEKLEESKIRGNIREENQADTAAETARRAAERKAEADRKKAEHAAETAREKLVRENATRFGRSFSDALRPQLQVGALSGATEDDAIRALGPAVSAALRNRLRVPPDVMRAIVEAIIKDLYAAAQAEVARAASGVAPGAINPGRPMAPTDVLRASLETQLEMSRAMIADQQEAARLRAGFNALGGMLGGRASRRRR